MNDINDIKFAHFNGSKFGGVLENFLLLPNFGVKNAKKTPLFGEE